ncbi:MAG: SDR family oxidoreductase [Sulfuricaulis sp.]|nr:SDR family oxidoreductase [Sulfuricaulis sp.]
MEPSKHVLVLGATGLVGQAAARHFAAQPGCRVTAVSRSRPLMLGGAEHLSLDLDDVHATAAAFSAMTTVTHVVYAAVQEQGDLVAGWTEDEHVRRNARMLRHVLEPLAQAAPRLRHVTALQGPKAYGVHVRPLAIPAREGRGEMREVPNFYWLQEDELRTRQRGKPWSWTIFRPTLVVGESVGGSMNLVATLGVYAALMRERGRQLPYPGAPGLIKQPSDVDLMARAIDWAGQSPAAANEVFNIDNGEVFCFETVWPAICDALGMVPDVPKPLRLADFLAAHAPDWDRIRARHQLLAPPLARFLGTSPMLADFSLGSGPAALRGPAILSSVKLRQAGFHEVMDSEEMFRKWFRCYQQHQLLPSPEHEHDKF